MEFILGKDSDFVILTKKAASFKEATEKVGQSFGK